MKKTNKKAFTLAELLVVVAIIAVLAAVSIPVFTNQLDKAQQATDLANIRAKYAEEVTAAIANGETTISISSSVLNAVLSDSATTVSYDNTNHTITVTRGSYSGSFAIDGHVTIN